MEQAYIGRMNGRIRIIAYSADTSGVRLEVEVGESPVFRLPNRPDYSLASSTVFWEYFIHGLQCISISLQSHNHGILRSVSWKSTMN